MSKKERVELPEKCSECGKRNLVMDYDEAKIMVACSAHWFVYCPGFNARFKAERKASEQE